MDKPKKKRGRPAKTKTDNRPDAPAAQGREDRVVTNYTIELIIGDKVYKSSAPTAIEALRLLERPQKIITKSLVVIHHGDRSKELFFMPAKLKRLFYPLSAHVTAKMLAMNI